MTKRKNVRWKALTVAFVLVFAAVAAMVTVPSVASAAAEGTPEIVDNSDENAYTGDVFTFNATVTNVTENADKVQANYTIDGGTEQFLNLSYTGWDNATGVPTYENTTTIPDDATNLKYNISALNDSGGIWNEKGPVEVAITDNIPPSITDNTIGTPYTGDDYLVNASVEDNVGVNDVFVNWSTDADSGNITMNLDSGTNYTGTIPIPAGATELDYTLLAQDDDNWAEEGVDSPVIVDDIIEPEIVEDRSPATAMTGDDYTFNASVSDNIDAGADITVKANYTTDVTSYHIVDMTHDGGTNYTGMITIPDKATTLEYNITAEDQAGNMTEMVGANSPVTVDDNIDPTITDNSAGSAAVGDDYTFNVTVTDNFDIAQVEVDYWFGTDSPTTEAMTNTAENFWTYEMSLPLSTDPLHYNITAKDSSDNMASTGEGQVTIEDNEDPVADAGSDEDILEGDTVNFDGSGSGDNVGVTNYTWTFDGTELYGQAPSYTFETPGDYTVTLTVTDDGGNENTDIVNITVKADTDGDGIPDSEDDDADGDGMNDTWEAEHSVDDPGADADDDGLTNLEEFEAGTDPNEEDTDGDGIIDGEDDKPLEKKEDDESDMPWMIIGVVVVIVIVIAVIGLMMSGGETEIEDEEFESYEEEEFGTEDEGEFGEEGDEDIFEE